MSESYPQDPTGRGRFPIASAEHIELARMRLRENEGKVADAIILERAVRVLERRSTRPHGFVCRVICQVLLKSAARLRTEAGWHA
jgi:hypothetical protein